MTVLSGRYELGATLGAGGMARVVEAYDRVLDRSVAVKLLRDDIATDPSTRERFLREARTAARFTHPNAVAVYDTGQDGRQPWIVMELIRGRDLSRRLTLSGRLTPKESVEIIDAVLAALEAAHRDDMVHRDVKPANIMLLDDGRVKLADFGIAKSVQDATAGMTATGQIIGTAKYLSPEQVEGHPATPASDVYATGVVLYEMLTGEPPFTGESAIAIALAHTRDTVPDIRRAVPGIPPALAAVVASALEKDPNRRFADAGEMRRALRGERPPAAATTAILAAEQPTRVLPRETPGRRREPARRSAVPWALIILAIAAIGAALALANGVLSPEREVDGAETPAPQVTEAPGQQEPTEAEAEPTEAPPPEPSPEPEPTEAPPQTELIPPSDLPTLISLLDAMPQRFGPKQDDLRKGSEKVLSSEGDKQAEEAGKLMDQTQEWSANGELEPAIAAIALQLLQRFAAADDEGDDGDDD